MLKNLLIVYSVISLLITCSFALIVIYVIDISKLPRSIVLLGSISYGLIPYIVTKFWANDIIDFFKFKKIKATNFFEYYETIPINIIYEISGKKYCELDKQFSAKAFRIADEENHQIHLHYSSQILPLSIQSNNIPFGFRSKWKINVFDIHHFSRVKCSRIIPFETIIESIVQTNNGYYYVKYRAGEHPFKRVKEKII